MSDYVSLLLRMLEAYSPSGKEESMADLLVDELKSRGVFVRKDEAGNVIAEVGSGKPHVLLCGHMDTVPGGIPVRKEGGRIYGRGAVDAKGPLGAMMGGMLEFASSKSEGKVTLVACVEEESNGRGVKHFVKSPVISTIDCGIFGEPCALQRITVGYRGRVLFSLRCKTKGGHAGAPWLFVNAIDEGYALWQRLRERWTRNRVFRSKFYSVSASLTKIRGGEYYNVVPSTCDMSIDVRVPIGVGCETILSEADEIIESFSSERGVEVSRRVGDRLEPYEADEQSLLVQTLKRTIREETGLDAVLTRKTGSGDMSAVGPLLKGAVVTYGPGNPVVEHTSEEHIKEAEFLFGVRIFNRTLEILSSLY